MIHLLDTDTLIYMVRGLKIATPKTEREKQRIQIARRIATRCRKQQEAGHDIGLSAITVAELEYGARHSRDYSEEMAAVRKILTPFMTFGFDAAACAEHYGEVRHALEINGTPIGAMDLLIAGHAKALGATLVTNNLKHFSRIADLKCENWL